MFLRNRRRGDAPGRLARGGWRGPGPRQRARGRKQGRNHEQEAEESQEVEIKPDAGQEHQQREREQGPVQGAKPTNGLVVLRVESGGPGRN